MSNSNAKSNFEYSSEFANARKMNAHMIRSKSPQFDMMNARLSDAQNLLKNQMFQKNLKDGLIPGKDSKNTAEATNLEIKTDEIVSFRNMDDVLNKLNSENKTEIDHLKGLKGNIINQLISVSPRKSKPEKIDGLYELLSDKIDMKIPIKLDSKKTLLENLIKKQNFLRSKNTVNEIINSDTGIKKMRSPSVIGPEKYRMPINDFVLSKTEMPKESPKMLFDLPLTKSTKNPKIQSTNNNETTRFSLQVKPEKEITPQIQTESEIKPKSLSMPEEMGQKRSMSEKIYSANGKNRVDILSHNPKNLIKFLMSQSKFLPEFDIPRVITKNYKIINSFAVTTHKGIVRNYNEDRVSVLLNVQQAIEKDGQNEQSKCYSLFSIFDGHGGYGCCNFLKDNLHNKLLESCDFESQNPSNLANIYKNLDYQYIKSAIDGNHKFSGSCAITIVIGPKFGLAINVGDSRAFCSKKKGTIVQEITKDHKPERPSEFNRVIRNNGELYRMSANQKTGEEKYYFIKQMAELDKINQLEEENQFLIFGPWRVKPGGLSVSRTFGDVESKMQSLGGLVGTVICEPETLSFTYEDIDFLVIGCDGIFDKLTNEKISETIWETVEFFRERYQQDPSIYETFLGECVNNVLKRAMVQRSEDNLTAIILCFRNLFL